MIPDTGIAIEAASSMSKVSHAPEPNAMLDQTAGWSFDFVWLDLLESLGSHCLSGQEPRRWRNKGIIKW
jgi:hypothetical protein